MRKQQTKQHILVSTIDAIEKYGINHLTTRLIAQERSYLVRPKELLRMLGYSFFRLLKLMRSFS